VKICKIMCRAKCQNLKKYLEICEKLCRPSAGTDFTDCHTLSGTCFTDVHTGVFLGSPAASGNLTSCCKMTPNSTGGGRGGGAKTSKMLGPSSSPNPPPAASGSRCCVLVGSMPRELDSRLLVWPPRRGHQSGHGSGQVACSVQQKKCSRTPYR
jgi:hypothetical protein